MWYMGHILTGLSITFTQNNYYVAVSFVVIGQFITIISRPIGRIKSDELKENENNNKTDYIPDII